MKKLLLMLGILTYGLFTLPNAEAQPCSTCQLTGKDIGKWVQGLTNGTVPYSQIPVGTTANTVRNGAAAIAAEQAAQATANAAVPSSQVGVSGGVAAYNDSRIISSNAFLTGSQNGSFIFAAPNGAAGVPAWRQLLPSDINGASANVAVAGSPLFGNFQGSGYPYLNVGSGSRLIFNQLSPGASDYGVEFYRDTTGLTLPNGLNHVESDNCTIGVNDASNAWCSQDSVYSSATTTGTGIGRYMQFVRGTGVTGGEAGWAAIMDTEDESDLPSATSGSALLSAEIDMGTNDADNRNNGSSYFGSGVRRWEQFNFNRKTMTDTTPNEMTYGLWFTDALDSGPQDADSYVDSLMGFQPGFQIRVGLDMRGAIPPSGSAIPVASVAMAAGQVIDFAGGTSVTSALGRPITYNATDTALEYTTPSTVFKFTDAGAFMASLGAFGGIPVNSGTEVTVGGTATVGLDLASGTFSGAAIRMAAGACLAYEGTDNIKVCRTSNLVTDFNGSTALRTLDGSGDEVVTGTMKAKTISSDVTTVASLPTCNSGTEGARAAVSDATSPTFLGTLTGGGTVHAPAYCNGTAWVSG
jgi:hypothetical protein